MTQANLYFTGKAAGSLVKIHDDMMWTTSVLIADRFGKRHDNVLQAIKNLTCSDEFRHLNFQAADYMDEQGKLRKSYDVSRDGFSMLAMGFTGKEAATWKEQFIAAFGKMERELRRITRQQVSLAWHQARSSGKTDRRDLTDAVLALARRAYARTDSTTPVHLWEMSATKTVSTAVFLLEYGEKVKDIRERLTAKQLNRLAMAEDIFAEVIIDNLGGDLRHGEISLLAKQAVERFVTGIGGKSVPGIDRRPAANDHLLAHSA
jgi:Rha family phage regulatory protein